MSSSIGTFFVPSCRLVYQFVFDLVCRYGCIFSYLVLQELQSVCRLRLFPVLVFASNCHCWAVPMNELFWNESHCSRLLLLYKYQHCSTVLVVDPSSNVAGTSSFIVTQRITFSKYWFTCLSSTLNICCFNWCCCRFNRCNCWCVGCRL